MTAEDFTLVFDQANGCNPSIGLLPVMTASQEQRSEDFGQVAIPQSGFYLL